MTISLIPHVPEGDAPLSPQVELPEGLKTVAVDGLEQMKIGCDRLRQQTEAVETAISDSCAAAMHGNTEFGLMMLDAWKNNVDAGFDLAIDMTTASSLPDVIEASSRYAGRQMEAAIVQTKDFWSCGRRVVADTARPIASGWSASIERGAVT